MRSNFWKKAIVTGASGQDAIALATYLIEHFDYQVFATTRRAARPQSRHVLNLLEKYPGQYNVVNGDITDPSSMYKLVGEIQPDEFYNLAAQSHVGESFKEPMSTLDITGKGVLNCLEAIRLCSPNTRFYQASSSEQYGGTKGVNGNWLDSGTLANGMQYIKINENTPYAPKSPYACAKVYAHSITNNYREAYGLHASCGILFNHEGIHRKLEFVTRKVTAAVTEIHMGVRDKLKLGTLNFARDWGWAGDYVRAMHLMLQQPQSDDYVIATGKAHTAEELLSTAFGKYSMDWREFVEVDEKFARPSDVRVLVGDASKAYRTLGFSHSKSFGEMINMMLDNDWNTYCKYGKILE